MAFRIADTFTDSLNRLPAEYHQDVKATAYDLQTDPETALARPGLQSHRLTKSRDPNFWSIRVSRDIRIILHRLGGSLMLCYVDHHDPAYRWAERRRLTMHPKTGAAQMVVVRDRVEEVPVYKPVERPAPQAPPPLAVHDDETLLSCGAPAEWLPNLRAAGEDALLDLLEQLPGEAAEALMALAAGEPAQALVSLPAADDPDDPYYFVAYQRIATMDVNGFDHPDAQRRFRVIADVAELERALDYPWAKWAVFLHPAQRAIVERRYNGPARVSGSAGTGKSIVALHRAVHLAREHPNARVLLTTFSEILAAALNDNLRVLISNEPRIAERLEVLAIDAIAERLHQRNFGIPSFASPERLDEIIADAASAADGAPYDLRFVRDEWERVVDAWQIRTWEEYRDVRRLGRQRRLPESRRAELWTVFERVISRLAAEGLTTRAGMFSRLARHFTPGSGRSSPFDYIVVDEAQDVSVAQLRFLAALGSGSPDALFFAGDQGQRIFQQPFSWRALGVDIRGRSSALRVNYRTSHQIRARADTLIDAELSDVDGNMESRRGTVSVFNGPLPAVRTFDDERAERSAVSAWLRDMLAAGISPAEISVFTRSAAQLGRAKAAIADAGLPFAALGDADAASPAAHAVRLGTMHDAKGLEFRAVAVVACDFDVIPSSERIAAIADESDIEHVDSAERHLLYVACTRPRDHLLVTGVEPASAFLDDLREVAGHTDA